MSPRISVIASSTMGTEKRARQKANRQQKLAEQEIEATRETRSRSFKKLAIVAGIAVAVVAVFAISNWIRSDDTDSSAGIDFAPTPALDTGVSPEEVPDVEKPLISEIPESFVPFAGEGALSAVLPSARNGIYSEQPPLTIDPDSSYAATIDTTAGPIRVNLFATEAPITVNNFVNLARDGFYDGVTFHRVLENFMAQGGDPTATGTGGPGYQFVDEFSPALRFDRKGLLAMANSGPASNGSQFFITFEPTQHLNDRHTIFGEVTGDLSVLDDIVLTGQGTPTLIQSVTIVEG